MKNQKGIKKLKNIISRANLLVAAALLSIGVINILVTGCGNTQSSTAPDFNTTPNTSAATVSTSNGAAANATISVVPSVQTTSPGANFDVAIRINTDTPTRSIQLILRWDPTKATCNSADLGPFYASYASDNKLTIMTVPDPLSFDNDIGKFPAGQDSVPTTNTNGLQFAQQYPVAVLLIGGESQDKTFLAPKGIGDVFVLHMTANSNASGSIDFRLSDVALTDNSQPPLSQNPKVVDGAVTVSGAK